MSATPPEPEKRKAKWAIQRVLEIWTHGARPPKDMTETFWTKYWPEWRFARALGELQILTRASYAMLAVVPLLAGVWIVLPFDKTAHLPRSWVLAFFAALAVTVGHIIYQLFSPEIVRISSLETYMRDARREYLEQPTPEREREADILLSSLDFRLARGKLHRPIRYYYPQDANIRELEGDFAEDQKITAEMMKKQVGEYVVRECLYRLVIGGGPAGTRYSAETQKRAQAILSSMENPTTTTMEARRLHMATKVGYAARARYLLAADQRTSAMISATILYGAAILLIVFITVEQILAVLEAGGWISFPARR
jgi:hypothetical protein